jgi:hypothetical protein
MKKYIISSLGSICKSSWSNFGVKARRIDDRELIRIGLIRINLRSLRSSILRSFHARNYLKNFCKCSLVLLGCSLHAVESKIVIRNREAAGVGYSTGYTSLDYSLMTEGSVEFLLDLRGHVLNNGQGAGNAGVGFRCPVKDEKYLLGANAFYDIRQSKGLLANQAGVGFEALSKYVDFRTNGYLPIGTKTYREKSNFEAFSGTSVLVKRKFKSALPCIDAEVGTPLPNPFYFAVGSYYLFKQSKNGLSVGNAFGAKARAEVDIGRYVSLGFAITYDRIFKTRPQGYLSVNIPFEKQKCKKRNGKKVCPPYKRNLRRVPIVRNEIIPLQVVKKTKDPLVGKKGHDPVRILFVNNLATLPGNGSFERPFRSLKDAELHSRPGDVIYVFPGDKTARNMDQGIVLKDKQILASSGADLTLNDITIPAQTPERPQLTNINPGQPIISNPGNTHLDDFFFVPPWDYILARNVDPFADARNEGFEIILPERGTSTEVDNIVDDFVVVEPGSGTSPQPLNMDDFVIVNH